jgi:UDP-N-acetylmuramate dehydrogenase
MHLDQKVSLKNLNTLGLDVEARYFVEARTREDIHTLLNYRKMIFLPVHILGGGSNVLFTGNFNGLVVHVNNKGILLEQEDETSVLVRAEAGEIWDPFVQYTVDQGWAGLEKLSLIPGTVGAAPIQNIGAYGAEVCDTIETVSYVDIKNGTHHTLTNAACHFGYRDSIFKRELKGRFIITDVCFRLKKAGSIEQINTLSINYRDLREELTARAIEQPAIEQIRDAVIDIRKRKLPDPQILGNAGSFFKNPAISRSLFAGISSKHPEIPFFPGPDDEHVKVPAAWLIEHCGWKGFREGDAGVFQNQPLVLVNHGQATGIQILGLANRITESVRNQFGITLETEVCIVRD